MKKPTRILIQNKGSSLIELLLYFSLLSIILILAVDLLISVGDFSLEANGKKNLQEDSRFIFNRLTYDIHQADSVTAPSGLGISGSTLTLIVGTETHTYSLSNGNLVYQKISGTTQTANLNSNATKINTLSFTWLGNPGGKSSIKVTIDIESLRSPRGKAVRKVYESLVDTR